MWRPDASPAYVFADAHGLNGRPSILQRKREPGSLERKPKLAVRLRGLTFLEKSLVSGGVRSEGAGSVTEGGGITGGRSIEAMTPKLPVLAPSTSGGMKRFSPSTAIR